MNTYLARKSKSLNRRLNDRLEREVEVLEFKEEGRIHSHFRGVSVWRVKLADLEAKSFGYMEIFVIVVFAVALWRLSMKTGVQAGTVYSIFSYIWYFVGSIDQIPRVVQQISKLSDINDRVSS